MADFDDAELTAAGWSLAPDNDGFIGHVGPMWMRRTGDGAAYGFVARAKHANLLGVVQGGMLMSLADRALGLGAWEASGRRCVTIQFDTQFVSSARIGEFVEITPQVLRRTRSLVFLRGDLKAGDRVLGASTGVWHILVERDTGSGAQPGPRA